MPITIGLSKKFKFEWRAKREYWTRYHFAYIYFLVSRAIK